MSWTRSAKPTWALLCMGVILLATPAGADFIRITVSGPLASGSSYTYAYAKAGTSQQTDSDASFAGANISSFAARTSGARAANANSSVATSGSLSTLTVSTSASGSSTSASGFAQKGMSYVSASEVPFDVIIESLSVSGVFEGDDLSWVEFHLNSLLSTEVDPLAPDAQDAASHGFGPHQSHTNFFLLQVLTDPTEAIFELNHLLGPNTRLLEATRTVFNPETQEFEEERVDRLLNQNDFFNSWSYDSWILNFAPWRFQIGITQPAGTQPLTAAARTSASTPPAVPEPSTLTLLGLGALALIGLRWRSRRARR